ncbi:MAG: DNA-processing protein DprA [Planctomycetota bacterium]
MSEDDVVSAELLAVHAAIAPWTRALLDRFHTPKRILSLSIQELMQVPGIGPAGARHLRARLDNSDLDRLSGQLERTGCRVLTSGTPGFPRELELMPEAPPVLFARGEVPGPLLPKIAIVGARRCSAYGRRQARRLAAALARRGFVVTSGLARGIDITAQVAALEAGSSVIAVLGSGLDVAYPPEHIEWIDRIAEQGAVLSEYPPGTPPRPENFPFRNRIISGLSLGVIVVEASLRSGSLITARYALEQGREVFAVPGPVDSPVSCGPHSLLRDGAKLVEEIEDVLEAFPDLILPGIEERTVEPEPSSALIDALKEAPRTADALAARLGESVDSLLPKLLELEVAGQVERIAGGRFAAR